MELDIIYNQDCILGMKEKIADEVIDLIIADPPYFKVVGEKWDYKWRVEDDYLEWSKEWIFEAVRTLRKGGSFYLFGYFRMLSKLLSILEAAGLSLRQQIIIDKGIKAVSGRATKNYKMFPNVTESVLFLYKDPKPFVRSLLKDRQKKKGMKAKEINERLGVKSNGGGMWSIYTGDNICEQLPTKEYWGKLEQILDYKYPYEEISITYNPQVGFTDVWNDIDFYEEKNRCHPTQKPQKLIRRLIQASSNSNDIVLDPFMGSGSTAIACTDENRQFIGFEIDPDYHLSSIERLRHFSELQQMKTSM
ncbi:MAG: site-specific DNA-methyltransferase [Defluviitaleaceae bacterium]|nr:site-specific DNA-methyltransferase [Defluviitaleaceae bacterium]